MELWDCARQVEAQAPAQVQCWEPFTPQPASLSFPAVPGIPASPASAHRHGPSNCCPWAQPWLPLRQSGSCQSYPRLSGPRLGLPGQAPRKTSAGGREPGVFWLARAALIARRLTFARRLMEWWVLGVEGRGGRFSKTGGIDDGQQGNRTRDYPGVGRGASRAGRQLGSEWRLQGGGCAGGGARRLAGAQRGRAAASGPAQAGSGWPRCPGLTRCVCGPASPGRSSLRAESSGEEEGASGQVWRDPCHLPPSRARHLLHRLGSSQEGSVPLGRCAAFFRVPLRAPAFRGRSPDSPGTLGFPSSQLHVQGYVSCRLRATLTGWGLRGLGVGGRACRVPREL